MRLFGIDLNLGRRQLQPDIGGQNLMNQYNRVAYEMIGGQPVAINHSGETYLKQGFGTNPDVFAVISQQYEKIKSVPYQVKRVKNKQSQKNLAQFELMTKGEFALHQYKKRAELQTKAYKDEEVKFPLEQPNPLQTWAEIWALYELYMQTTGNAYFYMVRPDAGVNKGIPLQMYVLPSHYMQIVLKPNADLLSLETPIDYYMFIEGRNYIKFLEEDIIHIKTPNPFFDLQGSHLYGLSPMRVLMETVATSNEAIINNRKTIQNGGVYGFISSKNGAWTPEQAKQMKERLHEMDASTGRLSRIAGASGAVDFTRISLNTDELKPFDYLKYNQKQICNVLGWSDKLLNNDDGAKYDNFKQAQKSVIINHIIPRLIMLQEALNKKFLPLFPEYKDCVIEWDYTELPEMQEDMEKLVKWYKDSPVTKNEFRTAMKLETMDKDGMNEIFIDSNQKRIDDVGLTGEELTKAMNYEY